MRGMYVSARSIDRSLARLAAATANAWIGEAGLLASFYIDHPILKLSGVSFKDGSSFRPGNHLAL